MACFSSPRRFLRPTLHPFRYGHQSPLGPNVGGTRQTIWVDPDQTSTLDRDKWSSSVVHESRSALSAEVTPFCPSRVGPGVRKHPNKLFTSFTGCSLNVESREDRRDPKRRRTLTSTFKTVTDEPFQSGRTGGCEFDRVTLATSFHFFGFSRGRIKSECKYWSRDVFFLSVSTLEGYNTSYSTIERGLGKLPTVDECCY